MKARLIKSADGSDYQILYANGSIEKATLASLADLLSNFKNIHHGGARDAMWSDECADMSLYPGETMAFVADTHNLIIMNFEPFLDLLESNHQIKRYVTVPEYAKMHGKSREIIKVFCREGRILGATKKGNTWMIPENAPYPVPVERQREGYRGPRTRRVIRTKPAKTEEG